MNQCPRILIHSSPTSGGGMTPFLALLLLACLFPASEGQDQKFRTYKEYKGLYYQVEVRARILQVLVEDLHLQDLQVLVEDLRASFFCNAAFWCWKKLKNDWTLTANNSPLKSRTPKKYHIFGNLWTSAFSWCPLDMVQYLKILSNLRFSFPSFPCF